MAPKPTPKSLKRISVKREFKEFTYLGCPLTRNRSPWCFRMCQPHANGTGQCGRIAPHSFKSRIQQGIEDFKKRQAETSGLLRCQEPAQADDSKR